MKTYKAQDDISVLKTSFKKVIFCWTTRYDVLPFYICMDQKTVIIKGFWEIFDKNRNQNNHLDLKENTTKNAVM